MESVENLINLPISAVPSIGMEDLQNVVLSSYDQLATLLSRLLALAQEGYQTHIVYMANNWPPAVWAALRRLGSQVQGVLERGVNQLDPAMLATLQQHQYIPVLILISGSVLVLTYIIFRRYFSRTQQITESSASASKVEESVPPKPAPRWKKPSSPIKQDQIKKESSPPVRPKKFWTPKKLEKKEEVKSKEPAKPEVKTNKSPKSWFRKTPKTPSPKAEKKLSPKAGEKKPSPITIPKSPALSVSGASEKSVSEEKEVEKPKSSSSWFSWSKPAEPSSSTTDTSSNNSNMPGQKGKQGGKSGKSAKQGDEDAVAKSLFGRSMNLNIDKDARPSAETKKMKKVEIELVRTMGREFRELIKMDEAGLEEKEEKKKDMEKVKSARSYFKILDESKAELDAQQSSNKFSVENENLEGTGLSVADLNIVKRRSNFYQQNGTSQTRLSQFQPGKLDKRIGSLFEGDNQDSLERTRPPKKKLITLDQVLKKDSPELDEEKLRRETELEELKEARKRWAESEAENGVDANQNVPETSSNFTNQAPREHVTKRWNPQKREDQNREEKSRSMIVPSKLDVSTIYPDKDKTPEVESKSKPNIQEELDQIRDSRPTPVTKRWQPKAKKVEKQQRSQSAHALQRARMPDDSWVLEKSTKAEEERRKGRMELEMVRRARQEANQAEDDFESSAETRMEEKRREAMRELQEVRRLRLAGQQEFETTWEAQEQAKQQRLKEMQSITRSRSTVRLDTPTQATQPPKKEKEGFSFKFPKTGKDKSKPSSQDKKEEASKKTQEKSKSGKAEKAEKTEKATKNVSISKEKQAEKKAEAKEEKSLQRSESRFSKFTSAFSQKKSQEGSTDKSPEKKVVADSAVTSIVARDMNNEVVTCTTVTQHIAEKHKQHVVRSCSGVRSSQQTTISDSSKSDKTAAAKTTTTSSSAAVAESDPKAAVSSTSTGMGQSLVKSFLSKTSEIKKSKSDTETDKAPIAETKEKPSKSSSGEKIFKESNKKNEITKSSSGEKSVKETTKQSIFKSKSDSKESTSEKKAEKDIKKVEVKEKHKEAAPKSNIFLNVTEPERPRSTPTVGSNKSTNDTFLSPDNLGPRFEKCNLKATSSGSNLSQLYANSKVMNAKPKPFASSAAAINQTDSYSNSYTSQVAATEDKKIPSAPWSPVQSDSKVSDVSQSSKKVNSPFTQPSSGEKPKSMGVSSPSLFSTPLSSSFSAATTGQTSTSEVVEDAKSGKKKKSSFKKNKAQKEATSSSGPISMDSLKILLSGSSPSEEATASDISKSVTFTDQLVEKSTQERDESEEESRSKSPSKRESRISTKFRQIKDKTTEDIKQIKDKTSEDLKQMKDKTAGDFKQMKEKTAEDLKQMKEKAGEDLKQMKEKTAEEVSKIRDRSLSPLRKKLQEREKKSESEGADATDESKDKEPEDGNQVQSAIKRTTSYLKSKASRKQAESKDVAAEIEDKVGDNKPSKLLVGEPEKDAESIRSDKVSSSLGGGFSARIRQFKDTAVEVAKTRGRSLQRKPASASSQNGSKKNSPSPSGSSSKISDRTRSESKSAKAVNAMRDFADNILKKR